MYAFGFGSIGHEPVRLVLLLPGRIFIIPGVKEIKVLGYDSIVYKRLRRRRIGSAVLEMEDSQGYMTYSWLLQHYAHMVLESALWTVLGLA